MRFLKKVSVMVIVMALAAFVVQQDWLVHIADSQWVADYLAHEGWPAFLLMSAVAIVYTAAGGPRQVLAFVFGYALGGWIGMAVSTLLTTLGAMVCFLVSRFLVGDWARRRFGKRLDKVQVMLAEKTALKVLMIRLLPVGSNLITNLLAGATHIRLLPFLAGSFVGYIPQMAVFALLGAGIGVSDHRKMILSIVLFIVASIIGLYLYRTRSSRQIGELVTKDL
ncbi:DedA family protein [Marinobacter sp. R17]|uniref:TVP38/TMEM64 family protein n=1 Tax=Marinobacter sp. R17 TaxID=2484250 RepID=UPI000F4CB655|nr:VTT domain-containing protein [Marinobacter sp. R17]ROT99897.1 DedA family protein [Marinobacter sp. R17]